MTNLSTQAQAIVDVFYFTFADKRVDFTIQELNNNALANVLRALVSNNEEWVDGTYMVKSEDILNIATELENL
jgi:hypothetical protein